MLGIGNLKIFAKVNNLDCKKWEYQLYEFSKKPFSKKATEYIHNKLKTLKGVL